MNTLSQALSNHLAKEAPPAPRRKTYEMPTTTRLHAIENGKAVEIPECATVMTLTNLVLRQSVELGYFPNPPAAILFAVSGTVRYGHVTLQDILLASKSRAGFTACRHLSETEISHLLNNNRLTFNLNRVAHELSLARVESDGEFELIVETDMMAEGRKFR